MGSIVGNIQRLIPLVEARLNSVDSNPGKSGENDLIRIFNAQLNPPASVRDEVIQSLELAGEIPRIQRVTERLLQLKNDPHKQLPLNFCAWVAFQPPFCKKVAAVPDLTTMPVLLAKLPFKIEAVGICSSRATWQGMQTCTCRRTSPVGLDKFAEAIKNSLEMVSDDCSLLLLHMGSGGCLFDAVLLTHLVRFKHIHWVFIDTDYASNFETDDYQKDLHELESNSPKSVLAWMQYSRSVYPHPMKVTVANHVSHVIANLQITSQSRSRTILFTEDFTTFDSFYSDFQNMAKAVSLHCRYPRYFCFDEVYLDKMELSEEEAFIFKVET